MMEIQTVWVDVARCTGCGACIELCPVGAIALVDGRVHVDDRTCTGCGACLDVCEEGAIQFALQGELVPTLERPVPAVYRPSPLAETAGTAVAVAGVGLLAKAAGVLARAVGRWVTRGSAPTRPSADDALGSPGGAGGGRRIRHRRRGG